MRDAGYFVVPDLLCPLMEVARGDRLGRQRLAAERARHALRDRHCQEQCTGRHS